MKKVLKTVGKILLIIVLIIALLAAGTGIYYAAAKSCTLTVKVNADNKLREFYGWGTSDCWWADDISDSQTREELADLLFSESGLNLSTYRYCLYAGYDENNNRVSNEWRLGESFYYYNEESGEYEYDWSRDADSQAMLAAALERGVDTVILFANSPHYSMCVNGQSSGAETNGGWDCNIDESRYQDYVDYFLTITEHFIDEGVPVKYISPINEPQWAWGGDWVGQEGCHYEVEQAVALLKLFAKGIKERGLDVELYTIESGNIGDTAKRYYSLLSEDEDISDVLGAFSVHSYYNDNDQIKKSRFGNWAEETVDVRFDMSEWCELPCVYSTTDVRGACVMARVISNDIGSMNVNAWSNWVAVNQTGVNEEDGLDYSDGLIIADPEDTTDYYLSYRYYAYMQYSAFIPAGSYVLKCGDGVFTTAYTKDDEGMHFRELVNETAYLTPDGDIVVVVVNEGNARDIKFDVESYKNVTVYTTSSEYKCEETYSGECLDKYSIDEYSINTYVFSNNS
ncbi:MAG: hypothetical protein LUH82_02355 [Clostridiales bacterium]|nr:hypothetical protein [Clostridiales bacterium]